MSINSIKYLNYRKTVTVQELKNFISSINSLLAIPQLEKISLNNLNSFLIPNPNHSNLNLQDKAIEIIPDVYHNLNSFKSDTEYIGFRQLTAQIKYPLTSLSLEKVEPISLQNALIITTPAGYSGLSSVQLKELNLKSSFTYTLTAEDLAGIYESTNNAKTIIFNDEKYFGTQMCKITLPLIDSANLVVTPATLNCTFYPADYPPDWDGDNGITAKLGIKRVTLNAALTELSTEDFARMAWKGGGILAAKNKNFIAYETVQLPPIGTLRINLNNSNAFSDFLSYSIDRTSNNSQVFTVDPGNSFCFDNLSIQLPDIITVNETNLEASVFITSVLKNTGSSRYIDNVSSYYPALHAVIGDSTSSPQYFIDISHDYDLAYNRSESDWLAAANEPNSYVFKLDNSITKNDLTLKNLNTNFVGAIQLPLSLTTTSVTFDMEKFVPDWKTISLGNGFSSKYVDTSSLVVDSASATFSNLFTDNYTFPSTPTLFTGFEFYNLPWSSNILLDIDTLYSFVEDHKSSAKIKVKSEKDKGIFLERIIEKTSNGYSYNNISSELDDSQIAILSTTHNPCFGELVVELPSLTKDKGLFWVETGENATGNLTVKLISSYNLSQTIHSTTYNLAITDSTDANDTAVEICFAYEAGPYDSTANPDDCFIVDIYQNDNFSYKTKIADCGTGITGTYMDAEGNYHFTPNCEGIKDENGKSTWIHSGKITLKKDGTLTGSMNCNCGLSFSSSNITMSDMPIISVSGRS